VPGGPVGISLLTLVPGVVGGTETYARGLVRALALTGELAYRVFLPRIARDAAGGLDAVVADGYAASDSTPGRIAAMSRAALLPGPLRRELGFAGLGLVHYPLTIALPRAERRGPPSVVTSHDLIHHVFPRLVPPHERAYRRLAYEGSIKRADLVIAVSRHLAELLSERLGVPERRIRVVYPGVDGGRFSPADRPREPFLLYPANAWPHKNHARLLRAFELVRAERPEVRLALAGQGHGRRHVPEGVDVLGHVSHERLAELYRRAAALVFPSLHEAFPQPPLEAMASGCPVACSAAGGLPEVCGDAARYFDPTSVEEMAQAILDVLADRGELAARGLERARLFTWDAAARAQDAAYRELLA
jgi:glycosyltransferase involved in cell wall biosynthesis